MSARIYQQDNQKESTDTITTSCQSSFPLVVPLIITLTPIQSAVCTIQLPFALQACTSIQVPYCIQNTLSIIKVLSCFSDQDLWHLKLYINSTQHRCAPRRLEEDSPGDQRSEQPQGPAEKKGKCIFLKIFITEPNILPPPPTQKRGGGRGGREREEQRNCLHWGGF